MANLDRNFCLVKFNERKKLIDLAQGVFDYDTYAGFRMSGYQFVYVRPCYSINEPPFRRKPMTC
jgi:hypothetical protein